MGLGRYTVHVEKNQKDYDKKYEVAISALKDLPEITRPNGGFYIWLNVHGDDQILPDNYMKKNNVIVLPDLI